MPTIVDKLVLGNGAGRAHLPVNTGGCLARNAR